MNERIQELMAQADMKAPGGKWKEYFAELIVQECIAVADKTQLVDRQLAVSFALKEHFGVK